MQEDKAPGRQRSRRAMQQVGKRCRRTRRLTDTGAEELGATQAEAHKNDRQKNKQAEKINRRQTELQTT